MKEIFVTILLFNEDKTFQVEAFSDWSGQSLVAADHLIRPPPWYEVLRRYPDRHPGHNHPRALSVGFLRSTQINADEIIFFSAISGRYYY